MAAIVVVLGLGSCIRPFDPPQGDFSRMLVVEGLLTDREGSYVKLSHSIPIDTLYQDPERRATVVVSDASGNDFVFAETAPGHYTPPAAGTFEPLPGMQYKLECQLQDGTVVRSLPVTMRATPAIDSLHWRWTSQPVLNGSELGTEIMVTTSDAASGTGYYQWTWHETWQYTSAFRSTFKYEDGEVVPRSEDIYTCYADRASTGIIVGTSTNLSSDIIYAQPVRFVSAESSDRLRIRYSILVTQRSLDEESFAYWENLKELNESTGTLFDVQPGQLLGNLYAVNEPSLTVLGYFDAAQTVESRLFIDRTELPQIRVPTAYLYCEPDTLLLEDIPDWSPSGLLLVQDLFGMTDQLLGYSYSFERCVDCRIRGTNQKPDFWE